MKSWTALLASLILLLTGCSNWDEPKAARAERAAQATGDIVIGAVWPFSIGNAEMWRGIELATDEINAGGGVIKRKLRLVKEDDGASLANGRLIAQNFGENRDMVAVIGHYNSFIALPASSIYHAAGLVYLTPGAASYQINSQDFDMTFRSVPSNRSTARRIAEDMAVQGLKRVLVYYAKDVSSQGSANFFEERALELGMTIVDRRSYVRGSHDFASLIQNWKDLYQFDGLFVAAAMPESGYFIAQAAKARLNTPIFSNEGVESESMLQAVGAAAEGIRFPELLRRDETVPAYVHFKTLYERKYKQGPSVLAAQGYDSVHLLAQAITKANSSVPEKIAQALHATQQWKGATGAYTFDDKGDIPDKQVGIKVVRNGKFESVDGGAGKAVAASAQ